GHRVSDLWIEDASYLRITNVTLGYGLPETLVSRSSFIKSCRVYVTMQNLATFTNYSGANPEGQSVSQSNTLAPGFDISSYPLARTASFDINLTFLLLGYEKILSIFTFGAAGFCGLFTQFSRTISRNYTE